MRQATAYHNPSLVRDIGTLAGLYRTVFWMIGRKSHYGRIYPPEAEMGPPEAAITRVPPVITVAETTRHATVEVGALD